jgi:hypothetical protein
MFICLIIKYKLLEKVLGTQESSKKSAQLLTGEFLCFFFPSQITMVELSAVLKNLSDEPLELDLGLKVEEAQKELEVSILRAEQLLGQRERPGGFLLKYKVGRLFPWEQISALMCLSCGCFLH